MSLRLLRMTSVALLLLAGACGVKGKVEQGRTATPFGNGPTTTTPRPTTTTPRPAPGNRPEVKVTDDGSGDKTKLRLTLHKGARTNLAVKVTTGLTQVISGRTQRVELPPITEEVELRITDVRDGVASFHFEITGAKLDDTGSLSPSQSGAIESGLRRLVGLSSDGTIDDRGATLSSKVHIPASVPATTRQTLQQLSDQLSTLSVPLPEEPVGEGATWTSGSTVKLSGAKVDVRSDYNLTKVDGPTYTIEVNQHQTAARQPFKLPTLPPGAKAEIVEWNVKATGVNTLKLGNIFPEAKLHASGRQSFTVTLGKRRPQSVKQDLSVDTEIIDLGN